jgi:hypothetical protein
MGLLDDAIREHLELKRRRGADPDEVARLEDEALGDPRSGEFAQPETALEELPAAEPEPVAEPEPPAPEPPLETPDPAAAAPAPRDEPWLDDEDRPEPPVGQPTAEFAPPAAEEAEAEEAKSEEAEPEVVQPDEEPGEDVLEETPDFLQETPEHDRLWFEQKPPRDFDFDS